jgi:hypothetical protein
LKQGSVGGARYRAGVGLTEGGAERRTLIDRAVRTWTGELIDLGGRNTLLYYRDLKQGTLDIGPVAVVPDHAPVHPVR